MDMVLHELGFLGHTLNMIGLMLKTFDLSIES